MTRLPALVTALLVTALLAACSPGTAAPSPTGTPSGGASPTPEPDEVTLGSRPDARTDATCDDILPPGSFDHLFTAPLALVDETRTAERIGTVIAADWIVREAGGLACEWQDAASEVTSEGYFSYQGVKVLMLPATPAQADTYFDAALRYSQCTDNYYCHLEGYTETGWWVSVTALYFPEANPGAAASAELERVLARVADLPAPRDAQPPASGDALAAACDAQVTPAQMAAAFGAPSATVESTGYPSIWKTAEAVVGGSECLWTADRADLPSATVTVLPGGEWAMARAVAAYGDAERIALPGSSSGGYFRPQVDVLGFDFAVDGDWVQITISEYGTPPSRDFVVAVATAFLANAS